MAFGPLDDFFGLESVTISAQEQNAPLWKDIEVKAAKLGIKVEQGGMRTECLEGLRRAFEPSTSFRKTVSPHISSTFESLCDMRRQDGPVLKGGML